ncbi:MAG TPA: ectonucleotide pyrophosphatase/phosphodiesterase [Terriglobia bacterium]|nr:ectonucleotide pyrophosphatase/phosphodiesterase [Terriglobia bacterium]
MADAPRLVVLSVDGMHPDFYRRPDEFGLKSPNLRRLVSEGASADAVESIYPSTTYPAHATLVTGAPPRTHGVYSHLASRDPTEQPRAWQWFASAVHVPALWDAARAAGLKTAAISWPVSAGAAIDYNIPEIWDPAAPDPERDFETAARHSTPGVFDEMSQGLGPLLAGGTATSDRLRSEAAIYLWRRHQPHLLLVHFIHYDALAHRYGPTAPESLAAIEEVDAEIGRIADAVQNEPVTLVVLSDHGFVPVEKDAAPHVVLLEEKLFERAADGRPVRKRLGTIHAGGSFAFYWLEPPTPSDVRALEGALQRISDTGAVAEVLDRAGLETLGADPKADLMLDAAPGFYFSDRWEGSVIEPGRERGAHGHLPARPGLEASFIATGAGITAGNNLGHISLTQIAPTLARLLGLRWRRRPGVEPLILEE